MEEVLEVGVQVVQVVPVRGVQVILVGEVHRTEVTVVQEGHHHLDKQSQLLSVLFVSHFAALDALYLIGNLFLVLLGKRQITLK